jgi:anti-anti-sigma regulatory factor
VLSDKTGAVTAATFDDRPVIKAGDYLNKLTGEQIEYECRRKLDAGATEIVLDFAETELVNSIGISILLGIADVAAARGAKIICADVKEDTVELFDMLGVTKHVSIVKGE